jgi:hypothetical protein
MADAQSRRNQFASPGDILQVESSIDRKRLRTDRQRATAACARGSLRGMLCCEAGEIAPHARRMLRPN